MAEIDTGLGWSAKDEWLLNVASKIGDLIDAQGGERFPNQPIGELDTPTVSVNDVIAVGTKVLEWTNPQYQWVRTDYFAASGPAFVYVEIYNGAYYECVISTRSDTKVYLAKYVESSPALSEYTTNMRVPGSSDLYYWVSGEALALADTVIESGIYTIQWQSSDAYTASLMAAGITVDRYDVFKDTSGYSVTCVAQWYSENGTHITSPVLISSDPTFVDMSIPDGNYDFAKVNFTMGGMRFYMGFFNLVNKSFTTTFPRADLRPLGNIGLETVFAAIAADTRSHIVVTAGIDPYTEEGAGAQEGGGGGEETEDDENGIEINSDYPSAINTGFCRIYTPSETELRNLSNYLWSNSYDLDQVKKLFSNPMDSVIGLSAVPIHLSGASVSFSLGGVQVPNMTLPMVSQQRYTYFMGAITVKERWGSYLDYDPYTKFSIFLPFIGMRELSTDDIMGKQVMLYYDIDILSGICTARLQAGKLCLYEWGGSCALQLPINSRNWDSVFNTAVGAVSGIVSAVSGGAAPLVAGSVASAALQTVSMKPRIEKSGNVSGASGWLGQMRPYLIRTTPEAYIPGNQNQYIGYPSYVSVSLDNLTGYNEVDSIHLEDIPATGDELAELESILKGGAIF